MRKPRFGENVVGVWGGSNSGMLDTRPELSLAPSASARIGKDPVWSWKGLETVTMRWTPNPASRYYWELL